MPAAFPHGHAVTRRLLAAACVIAALLALALAGGNGHGNGPGTAAAQTHSGWGTANWDYDNDGDNLIDIWNLAQLNAVRWDLDGQGDKDSESTANWTKYQAAFPNAASGMGCAATCTGYELRASLDFDTDGDGKTHTGDTGDAGDTYNNGGAGWFPIGGAYTATFQGNGHTIDNLFIKKSGRSGLFDTVTGGTIIGLGLRNAYIRHTAGGGNGENGILAGYVGGSSKIAASYTTGEVRSTAGWTCGMVGTLHSSTITASYSTAQLASNHLVAGIACTVTSGTVMASYYAGPSAQGSASDKAPIAGAVYGTFSFTNVYYDGGKPAPAATSRHKRRQESAKPLPATPASMPTGTWTWTAYPATTTRGTSAPAASTRC